MNKALPAYVIEWKEEKKSAHLFVVMDCFSIPTKGESVLH